MPGGSTCALPRGTLAGDFGRCKAEDPACASTSKSRRDGKANDRRAHEGAGGEQRCKSLVVTTTSGVGNSTRASRERNAFAS
jgi:hypothetical protein